MEVLGVNLPGLVTQLISFGILGGLVLAIVYVLFFQAPINRRSGECRNIGSRKKVR